MKFIQSLKPNLILSLAFSFFTYLSHIVYVLVWSRGNDPITLDKYISIFIIFLVFSFIKQKKIRFMVLGMPLILGAIQFVHLEYYGAPVFPAEIYLFFAETSEVFGTVGSDLGIFLFSFLFCVLPLLLLYFLNSKIKVKRANKKLYLLFVVYLAFNPMRTFVTGNTWGRQPALNEFEGINMYLSISYFLGRVLPRKLSSKSYQSISREFQFKKNTDVNIIFVLGESASPSQMNVFGYKRNTTPFLSKLRSEYFYKAKGISSGVSSDVSIAFLMNNAFGQKGVQDAITGKNCLFKLAQLAGYKTHLYSSQSREQLRYIYNSLCPKFINNYKDLDLMEPDHFDPNHADDLLTLNELSNVNLEEKKQFIVLHHRGSHSPYSKRFFKRSNIFKSEQNIGRVQEKINYYDNSIVELDLYLQILFRKIDETKQKTLVVYVSDHGERVGINGKFGHGKLNRESYSVPVFIYSNFMKKNEVPLPKIPTHFNLSLLVSRFLGFETAISSSEQLKQYTVYGNDIDGFMGKIKLKIKSNSVEEKIHF